jgi:hypothetical protein
VLIGDIGGKVGPEAGMAVFTLAGFAVGVAGSVVEGGLGVRVEG